MYIGKNELTLDGQEIDFMVDWLIRAEELMFQSMANRNAVASRAKQRGITTQRSRTGNSVLDPRYTAEGWRLPDKGLANDTIFGNFYVLKVLS